LDKFVHGIDWKTFLSDAKGALAGVVDGMKSVAESASTIASAVGKTAAAVGGAWNTAAAGVHTAAGVIAGAAGMVVSKVGDAAGAVQELTGSVNDGENAVQLFGAALTAASDDNLQAVIPSLKAAGSDIAYIADASDDAATATKAHGSAASEAAPKIEDHAKASEKSAAASENLTQHLGLVPEYLEKTAGAAEATIPFLAKVSDEAIHLGGGALQDARKALADTAKAFADLQRDSSATPQAIEAARQAFIAASADLERLQSSAQGAIVGLGQFDAEMKRLGITSQQSLGETANNLESLFNRATAASDGSAASIADLQNIFLRYAQARLAATAQLDEGAKAAAQSEIESKAAALGLGDALERLEVIGKSAGDSTAQGADNATEALKREKQAMDNLGNSAGGASSDMQQLSDDTKNAQQQIKDLADGDGGYHDLVSALANTRQGFLNVSEAAAKAFDAKLISDWNLAFDSTGANIGKTVDAMNKAATQTRAQIEAERDQIKGIADSISNSTNMSVGAIDDMIESIKNGTYQFGVLGKQDLAPLLEALDKAKQKTEAAERAAAAAASRFDQLAQSIHDQLLQEQGDQQALEDERHKNQLQALADAAAAGKIDQAKYGQAVADENALHDLKMRHLQEEQQKQDQQQQKSGGGSSSGGGSGSGSGGGSSSSSASNSGGGAVSGGVPVTVNYPGRTFNFVLATPGQADDFSDLFQKIVRDRNNSINK
jgi:hypothetical protein